MRGARHRRRAPFLDPTFEHGDVGLRRRRDVAALREPIDPADLQLEQGRRNRSQVVVAFLFGESLGRIRELENAEQDVREMLLTDVLERAIGDGRLGFLLALAVRFDEQLAEIREGDVVRLRLKGAREGQARHDGEREKGEDKLHDRLQSTRSPAAPSSPLNKSLLRRRRARKLRRRARRAVLSGQEGRFRRRSVALLASRARAAPRYATCSMGC